MAETAIEWTDVTWNPTVGCTVVSPGCANCYAQGQAYRMEHGFKTPGYEGTTKKSAAGQRLWTGNVNCLPDRLDTPLHWRKPRRIFVNSMSDLFHEDVPDEFIDRVFGVMAVAQHHTFQVLTKRPERMLRYFTEKLPLVTRADEVAYFGAHVAGITWDVRGSDPVNYYGMAGAIPTPEKLAKRRAWPGWPLPNVWLGVSVENQAAADERIPLLLQTPAAVRWLSCEPLLGPVSVEPWPTPQWYSEPGPTRSGGIGFPETVEKARLRPRIDWVVVGGESGPGARPCNVGWLRSIVDQCKAAQVPAFVKQLGAGATFMREFAPGCDQLVTVNDRKGGDMAEWPEDLRVREYPT